MRENETGLQRKWLTLIRKNFHGIIVEDWFDKVILTHHYQSNEEGYSTIGAKSLAHGVYELQFLSGH